MKEFIEYAFYGDSYKKLDTNTVYNCYLMYCKLVDIKPMNKIKFIGEFNYYMGRL